MTDAAGEVSHGLTLTLTDDGGEKNKEAYVRLEAGCGMACGGGKSVSGGHRPGGDDRCARDKIRTAMSLLSTIQTIFTTAIS